MKIGILKGIKSWLFDKLHDINSYPEDQELRRDIEIYDHLLPHLIALQKRILPAKIKYFFKHEPTFFIKFILRILLRVLIWLSGIAALGVVVVAVGVLFFHLKINLKTEPIKVDNRELLIYVPNVGVKETDSLNMVFYKSKSNPKQSLCGYMLVHQQKHTINGQTIFAVLSLRIGQTLILPEGMEASIGENIKWANPHVKRLRWKDILGASGKRIQHFKKPH